MSGREHLGVFMRYAPSPLGIQFRECWCGSIWFAPPPARAESRPGAYDPMSLWCPNAPVSPGVLPFTGVLVVSVTSNTGERFDVRLRSRGLSTWLDSFQSKPRALLVAHTFFRAYGGTHGWAELLVRELQDSR